MDLLSYLNQYFYTQAQLLDKCKINELAFKQYQKDAIMPLASYKLNIQCDSFFGKHIAAQKTEYYPKAYLSWLVDISKIQETQNVFEIFSSRYKTQLKKLNELGFYSHDNKFNQNLSEHIKQEWQHFLKGTYGVCTKSGLVENIATKELTTTIVNELISNEGISGQKQKYLKVLIDLLDSVTSLFAPHERKTSSRVKLIENIRKKYFKYVE